MIKKQFVFLLLMLNSVVFGQNWQITNRPDWVDYSGITAYPGEDGDSRDGVIFHRYERQVQVEQGPAQYTRFVLEISGQQGLDQYGQLYFPVYPDYQTLTLHSITVYRNGQAINKLSDADIQELQQEQNLEYRLYDGSLTLSVVLKDMRIGDVLEYDYTLTGRNPVFKDLYFDFFNLNWGIPVRSQYYRIIHNEDRDLYYRIYNADVQLQKRHESGLVVLSWEKNLLEELVPDSETPTWYDPFAYIEFSSFKDWEDFSDWIVPYYQVNEEDTDAALAEADRLVSGLDKKDAAMALVDFVQNHIRYLGYEMGAHSYQPHACDLSLENRFGDCKDTSLLLTTMLNHIGIDASVALVSTVNYHTVGDYLPNPLLFNHAIVRFELDGQEYWIDPTRSRQGGSLDALYQHSYGKAFPVLSGQKELVDIPGAEYGEPMESVAEVVNGRDALDGSAEYRITTELRGYMAENLRYYLEQDGLQALERQYLNSFAEYYPDAEIKEPLSIEDRYDDNLMVVSEVYTVPGFWYYDEDGGLLVSDVYTMSLRDRLFLPEEQKRSSPYYLDYPVSVRHRLEFLLPDSDWDLGRDSLEIDEDAYFFDYQFTYRESDQSAVFDFNFKTKQDHVSADDIRQYVDDVNEAWEYTSWTFTYNPYSRSSASDEPENHGFIYFLISLLGFGLLCLAFWAYKKIRYKRLSDRARAEQAGD